MNERYRLRAAELHWQEVEGEVIALDTASSHYLGTNQTGAMLWEALGRGATRSELEEVLVSTYQVDSASARADVDAFLASLRELGLLEPAGE